MKKKIILLISIVLFVSIPIILQETTNIFPTKQCRTDDWLYVGEIPFGWGYHECLYKKLCEYSSECD